MCCVVGESAPTECRGFRPAEQQGDPSLTDGPRERGKSLSEHRRGLVGNRRGGGQASRGRECSSSGPRWLSLRPPEFQSRLSRDLQRHLDSIFPSLSFSPNHLLFPRQRSNYLFPKEAPAPHSRKCYRTLGVREQSSRSPGPPAVSAVSHCSPPQTSVPSCPPPPRSPSPLPQAQRVPSQFPCRSRVSRERTRILLP